MVVNNADNGLKNNVQVREIDLNVAYNGLLKAHSDLVKLNINLAEQLKAKDEMINNYLTENNYLLQQLAESIEQDEPENEGYLS